MTTELMRRFPAIDDLERRARRRIPFFTWEFVDSGTGRDECARRNREAFAAVRLTPRFMQGALEPKLSTRLFGVDYGAPFGVAPVGLAALIWPGTERILARTAARYRVPYSLSTAASDTPEAELSLSAWSTLTACRCRTSASRPSIRALTNESVCGP